MNNQGENLFRLDPAKIANPGLRLWVRLFRGLLERIFRFPALNRLYAATRALDGPACFSSKVLSAMGVTCHVGRSAGADGNPIPAEGPVVVVANHPYGGIEGVVMLSLMAQWRDDAKVLVNFMLSIIPDLRKDFLFVNPFGGANAKRENMASMKAGLKWLSEGHVLVVFPAGEVSSRDRATGLVRDIPWSDTVARMVEKTSATVVPIFFGGDNGRFFNFMGRIHPRLRTLLLPHELVNKAGRPVRVEVGDAITPREWAPFAAAGKLTTFLRLRTYILAERLAARPAAPDNASSPAAASSARPHAPRQAEIVPPVPPDELAAEIASLPAESLICEGDGLEVHCARSSQIHKCLREIGRLREVTYREVGEGTNAEIDLDKYDDYYLHLFLWNPEKREIAGAYRMGLADDIVAAHGVKGLYTSTCFDFDLPFIDAIGPAMELGRSFVRREYQRAFSSLMLLWKGICLYAAHNARYASLFGPVSISNDFLPASKEMIMRSMRLSCLAPQLVPLARPYLAPQRLAPREWLLPEYDCVFADQDAASKAVQEIEPDGKGFPVLVRQYSKMGGKVVCFNVDPAFNYCVDGLVSIRISEADERIMRRYMGADNYAAYMNRHAPKS